MRITRPGGGEQRISMLSPISFSISACDLSPVVGRPLPLGLRPPGASRTHQWPSPDGPRWLLGGVRGRGELQRVRTRRCLEGALWEMVDGAPSGITLGEVWCSSSHAWAVHMVIAPGNASRIVPLAMAFRSMPSMGIRTMLDSHEGGMCPRYVRA